MDRTSTDGSRIYTVRLYTQPMKGVVLAGGYGTRLRPLTVTRPKQLLPVANRPVLAYAIEGLLAAGVDELGVVVGGTHSDAVRSHLTDCVYDAPIAIIDQGEPRGLAHAVGCAESFVDGEPFVVAFGDTLLADDTVATVVDQFDPTRSPLFLPLQPVDNPSRFGIVEFDNGQPVAVCEKPTSPPSGVAYMGVVGLGPAVFDCIAELEPSSRGELELTAAIDTLLDRESHCQWQLFDGRWIDVGTPEDLLAANKAVLADLVDHNSTKTDPGASTHDSQDGAVVVGSGVRIDPASTLIGPVVIADDVHITGCSQIGPFVSVADGCRIEDATLQRTVLLDDVSVSGVDLRDSILGARAIVDSLERPARLVVGDDSVI